MQERLSAEITATGEEDPSLDTIQTMHWLTAVVYESLRLLPPIAQLITRRAATSVMLDHDKVIPEGTYVGYHSYSTNRDPGAWGSNADEFRPERWGASYEEVQKEYRLRRSRAEFISFHGGRRACLGERYALVQIKVTLFILVKEMRWRLDPEWPERLSAVSRPFLKLLHQTDCCCRRLLFTQRVYDLFLKVENARSRWMKCRAGAESNWGLWHQMVLGELLIQVESQAEMQCHSGVDDIFLMNPRPDRAHLVHKK